MNSAQLGNSRLGCTILTLVDGCGYRASPKLRETDDAFGGPSFYGIQNGNLFSSVLTYNPARSGQDLRKSKRTPEEIRRESVLEYLGQPLFQDVCYERVISKACRLR